MSKKQQHSRRHFIQKIAATGAMAITLPNLLTAAHKENETTNEEGKNTIFLFQGDSITDGNRTRNNDWNHLMGHGFCYLISSRLWFDHPAKSFHFINRGTSGNGIPDLTARWQEDCINLQPNVLNILVGVNDVNSAIDKKPDIATPVQFEEKYRALLQQTKDKLPNIQLIMCEPFLLPVGKVKTNWDAWTGEMKPRQEIVKKLAAELNAIFIPLQDQFDKACEKAPAEYWIWDGIHPMPAGHEMIARQWINIVKTKLHYIK